MECPLINGNGLNLNQDWTQYRNYSHSCSSYANTSRSSLSSKFISANDLQILINLNLRDNEFILHSENM